VTDRAYQQLWHVVDGAVRDAFRKHGDYLTPKGRHSAKRSIVKRVTGTVLCFALQEAKRQRELAVTDDRPASAARQVAEMPSAAEPDAIPRPATHSHAHVNEACYQAIRRALFPTRRTREIRRDARDFRAARDRTTAALRAATSKKARAAIVRASVGRGA
jgi:hypothetical protein